MRKRDELEDPQSCWNKARYGEILFILLSRDDATPATIRSWIAERIRLNLNQPGDAKLIEAESCARQIESNQEANRYGLGDDWDAPQPEFALMREELRRERAIKADLLAACEALVKRIQQAGIDYPHTMRGVNAALAKARGEGKDL